MPQSTQQTETVYMGTVKWERLRDKWALEAFGKPSRHSATYDYCSRRSWVFISCSLPSKDECLQDLHETR